MKMMRIDHAAKSIAACVRIDEAKDIKDKAIAVATYLRIKKVSGAARDDALEIAIRAERRMGELLRVTKKSKGNLRRGTKTEPRDNTPTLAELGVGKKESMRAQQLAALPARDFDERLTSARARQDRIAVSTILSHDPAHGGPVSHSDGYDSDEWYTPSRYVEAARAVMGGIDLDPASNAHAQKTIKASLFFTQKQDGLKQSWRGRLWINPPFSQPLAGDFCAKLIEEFSAGHVAQAILVQNASTDTEWFHALASVSRMCLTRGRINFDRADGTSSANRYGQVFFYLGKNHKAFDDRFSAFGIVGKMK